MKLTILIISMCIAGAFCGYYECYLEESQICDRSPKFEKFPETIDELKQDCMNFLDYKNCWLNVIETCKYYMTIVLRERNAVHFLNSTCQEDSPIFKVVARHFDCFSSAFNSTAEICNETRQKAHTAALAKYEELTSESQELTSESQELTSESQELLSESQERTSEELLRCIYSPFESMCFPIILGEKCGDEFGNAILEFMTNSYLRRCVDEFPEEWGALYKVYETVIREEYEKVKVLEELRQ